MDIFTQFEEILSGFRKNGTDIRTDRQYANIMPPPMAVVGAEALNKKEKSIHVCACAPNHTTPIRLTAYSTP